MKATFKNAWGYQGDAMNLPVDKIGAAVPYYEKIFEFKVVKRNDRPHRSVALERDGVQFGLAENGGDSSQNGCAFEIENVEALFEEFVSNGWVPPSKPSGNFEIESQEDGSTWKVFYMIAPDGLCYWFGERQ